MGKLGEDIVRTKDISTPTAKLLILTWLVQELCDKHAKSLKRISSNQVKRLLWTIGMNNVQFSRDK